MAKIVYNACYGGFSLSKEARELYAKLSGLEGVVRDYDIERNDPALVRVVEELGRYADGPYARLRIVEIPDGSRYRIDEYDGFEKVETPESYDWKIA